MKILETGLLCFPSKSSFCGWNLKWVTESYMSFMLPLENVPTFCCSLCHLYSMAPVADVDEHRDKWKTWAFGLAGFVTAKQGKEGPFPNETTNDVCSRCKCQIEIWNLNSCFFRLKFYMKLKLLMARYIVAAIIRILNIYHELNNWFFLIIKNKFNNWI